MALLHVMQFWAGNVTSVNPTKTTLYTVPAGYRAVVRRVSGRNLAGVARAGYVYLNGTLVHTLAAGAGGSSSDSPDWATWQVLTPGQLIQMSCEASTGFGVIVSGSLYFI